jgi:hypothetical protein
MAKLMLKFKPVVEGDLVGKVEEREMSEFLGFDESIKALVYRDESGKPHYVFADILQEFILPKELPGHNHEHGHHHDHSH